MKKVFMILRTLAVLAAFAGCSNPSSDSSKDYGSFTVKESISLLPNQSTGEISCFPKNEENQYYGYIYTITEVTKDDYKSNVNTDVFYTVPGNGVSNMFKTSCKDKVEKMLKEGNFTIIESKSWAGYNAICLNSHP